MGKTYFIHILSEVRKSLPCHNPDNRDIILSCKRVVLYPWSFTTAFIPWYQNHIIIMKFMSEIDRYPTQYTGFSLPNSTLQTTALDETFKIKRVYNLSFTIDYHFISYIHFPLFTNLQSNTATTLKAEQKQLHRKLPSSAIMPWCSPLPFCSPCYADMSSFVVQSSSGWGDSYFLSVLLETLHTQILFS